MTCLLCWRTNGKGGLAVKGHSALRGPQRKQALVRERTARTEEGTDVYEDASGASGEVKITVPAAQPAGT